MEQYPKKRAGEESNMAFLGPSFRREERAIWRGADDLGKKWCFGQWRTQILADASVWYSRKMRDRIHLTNYKVDLVMAQQPPTLDPFEVDGQEDLVNEPIDVSRDAELVVLWSEHHSRSLTSIKSHRPMSYFSSKFRFYRRMHFRIEKTAECILKFRQAKEDARVLGYFDVGFTEPFSFAEFVKDPNNYTTEAFEQTVASTLELQEMDRQEAMEYEQQVEYSSTSSEEED
jgi:hypothetical protein